jgi:hypothetical protein
MGYLIKVQSVHSCTSNTSSIFRPSVHDTFYTYFVKSRLHVSVCYTPNHLIFTMFMCYVTLVMSWKIKYTFFGRFAVFFTMIVTIFCACYSVC